MKKSEIQAKEKLIIENFAKVFNSIKRIDENEINEYSEVQVGDTYLVLQPFSIVPSIKSTTMIPPRYAKEDGSFPFEKGEKISVKKLVELNGIKTVYFQKTIDFFYFHTAPVGFFEKAVTEGKLQKLGSKIDENEVPMKEGFFGDNEEYADLTPEKPQSSTVKLDISQELPQQ